ncbi:hypothetical protein DFR29_12064 [Tahibacter aquaticus]|jgi:hypothetical protein|uniref:Uncharacterized protein n=1 Tax=Tahibacter aquaticus TaxID=520092 RepID=A0A4R6YME4_9GAMM|nr:hypothetical protein [Tahibacter aquaticus]TDR38563.1 hypothetical protein DFR29_12064 [Tahibacter aquaticus]
MNADSIDSVHHALPTWLSPETRGTRPLWRVFWIYGVFCSQLLFAAILFAFDKTGTPLFALALAGFASYSLLITRLVWVNADNVRDLRYGQVARFLTVTWALNALLMSGFLLLSHLGDHSRPLIGG